MRARMKSGCSVTTSLSSAFAFSGSFAGFVTTFADAIGLAGSFAPPAAAAAHVSDSLAPSPDEMSPARNPANTQTKVSPTSDQILIDFERCIC